MGCSKRGRDFDYDRDDHKDNYKPPHYKHYKNCVEDVLEGKKVKKDDCCKSSCKHSITQLQLEPYYEKDDYHGKNKPHRAYYKK